MSRKRETPVHAGQGYTGPSYRLPAYGSPRAPARRPGSSPAGRAPGVDDRLAVPEAAEEVIDGVRYAVMPAEAEHADPRCQLAYVVRACVAEGYVASTELLTRTDEDNDFATDVCVRREGEDPKTRQRYLEELSFEVANTQTLSDLKARAKKLVARGVRRLFAVMVREKMVHEWTGRGWKARFLDDEIRDRTLRKPLRIRAILEGAAADSLVAEALWEKAEPYLVKLVEEKEAKGRKEGRAEGLRKGRVETLRQAIRDLCEVLGIEWATERDAEVRKMGSSRLEALRKGLVKEKRWPDQH